MKKLLSMLLVIVFVCSFVVMGVLNMEKISANTAETIKNTPVIIANDGESVPWPPPDEG